jgi:hypothetical protein
MSKQYPGPALGRANLEARIPTRNTAYQSAMSTHSTSNSVLGDMPSIKKRNSISSTYDHHAYHSNSYHPTARFENTYALEPNENQKFNVSRIEETVKEILNNHLENVKYEPNKCKDLVQLLSDEIKTRVKSLVYKRYKIIATLTIGQNVGNSVIMASRSLWNTETDNGCTVVYKNNTIFAVAAVFATYNE